MGKLTRIQPSRQYPSPSSHVSLAAQQGFLDLFQCQKCNISLSEYIQEKRPGWLELEIRCGSKDCFASRPELVLCPCYWSPDTASNGYFGCRISSSPDVLCAYCFRFCPECDKQAQSSPGSRAESTSEALPASLSKSTIEDAHQLYHDQELLLKLQLPLFSGVTTDADSRKKQRKLLYKTDRLQVRVLKFSKKTGWKSVKDILAVLQERQHILYARNTMLDSWRETKEFPGIFHNVVASKLLDQLDDFQERLSWLEKSDKIKVLAQGTASVA